MDITPKLPISLNGGMTDRKAMFIHDPLHARCLVLASGKTTLALVVVDSCMVPDEVVQEAKRLIHKQIGIPPSQVLISATHTHSAPTLAPTFQSGPDRDYVTQLPIRIAMGVQNAVTQMQPAELGFGSASEPKQVFNRRWYMKPGSIPPDPFGNRTDRVRMNPPVGSADLLEPAGPTDPEVCAISVRSKTGSPLAVLANYSLHYVGDVPGTSVSADYFGEFARQMSRRLPASPGNPPFVGILSNGTSGDCNNINFRTPHPKTESGGRIRLVAHAVAEAASAGLAKASYANRVEIRSAVREITLKTRRPNQEEIVRARRIVASAKGSVLRSLDEIYAGETLSLAEYPAEKRVVIQAIRLGNSGIVAIPCEVFAEIGLKLKRESPIKPIFTISLANGYSGYLPTPEHHRLGGYETWRAKSSFLEVDASRKIESTALELLASLAK
jgi:hypothetical protein